MRQGASLTKREGWKQADEPGLLTAIKTLQSDPANITENDTVALTRAVIFGRSQGFRAEAVRTILDVNALLGATLLTTQTLYAGRHADDDRTVSVLDSTLLERSTSLGTLGRHFPELGKRCSLRLLTENQDPTMSENAFLTLAILDVVSAERFAQIDALAPGSNYTGDQLRIFGDLLAMADDVRAGYYRHEPMQLARPEEQIIETAHNFARALLSSQLAVRLSSLETLAPLAGGDLKPLLSVFQYDPEPVIGRRALELRDRI